MDDCCGKREIRFVSFSGIDGAGKSTQIRTLCARLRRMGLRVELITFWNDIASLTRFRESAGRRIFKGDKGVGTPTAPIVRRDKNVRAWPMTWLRLLLYFIDSISVRFAARRALRSDADFVVFDRYIYDELANLPLDKKAMRAYAWLIMKIVPRPHVSYVLDADPIQAYTRKPEYPLEFLHTNRQSYLTLSQLIGGMTVIAPMPIHKVEREVLKHALKALFLVPAQGKTVDTGNDGSESARLDEPHRYPAAS